MSGDIEFVGGPTYFHEGDIEAVDTPEPDAETRERWAGMCNARAAENEQHAKAFPPLTATMLAFEDEASDWRALARYLRGEEG